MSAKSPIETKVKASTAAAVVAGFIDWVLATYAFHGNNVPEPVQAFVLLAVAGVLTFGAGYMAKHTPRSDVQNTKGSHLPPSRGSAF